MLGPYLTKVAIDHYLAPRRGTMSGLWNFLSPQPLHGIAQIAAMYVGLLLVSFVLEFLQTYFMQWTGQKVMFDLRSQIFRHLQRMHVGFFDNNPVGRLVTRVTTDVDALNEMFTSGVVSIFEDIFVLAGILGDHAVHELAAGADHVCGAAGDRFRDADLSRQGARLYRRIRVAIARINCLSAGTRHAASWCCNCSTASASAYERVRDSQRAAHGRVQGRDHGLRACTTRWWKSFRRSPSRA